MFDFWPLGIFNNWIALTNVYLNIIIISYNNIEVRYSINKSLTMNVSLF